MKLWRSNPSAPTEAPAEAPAEALPGVSGDGAGAPPPAPASASDMPFLDHLEELRWHLFKAIGGVAAAAVVCLIFADTIIDRVLLAQTKTSFFMYDVLRVDAVNVVLQNRSVTGQFFAYYGTVLAAAVVIGSPLVVYQIWRFIEPGLYPQEKKGVRFASVFATFFFACGIAFGYLVVAPLALQYFAQFVVSDQIVNEFDISRYFSMLIGWTFGAGLLFELPVVVFVLARLEIVSGEGLARGRRFALVVILLLSAFFTPPDPLSMIIMAIPLLGLYELSILFTRLVERGRRREAARLEKAAAGAEASGAVVVADSSESVPDVSRPDSE